MGGAGRLFYKSRAGFTLVEAVLAIVIVAATAGIISALFMGAMQASEAQTARVELQGQMRGQLEAALSQSYDLIVNTSTVVSLEGSSYTIQTTVAAIDLNGDGVTEPDAKQVTVAVVNTPLTLTTIVVNTSGVMGVL